MEAADGIGGGEAGGGTRRRRRRARAGTAKLSRTHPPPDATLESWQVALRRQFGRAQRFRLENVGAHPVVSEFLVTNPASRQTYRVAIRGVQPGDNFCSCPDFATNQLGTCKHVEFTLARLERQPGGRTVLREGFGRRTARSTSRTERAARYASVRGPTRPPPWFGSRRATSTRPACCGRGLSRRSGSSSRRHPASSPGFRCYEDALAFVAEVRDARQRHDRLARAFPRGLDSPAFDDLLRVPLYPYQREGAFFAAGAGRCLIGDEMGLGKTAQAIAAVEILARLFGVERVLVVCPTSLKHQWEREIGRFTQRVPLVVGGPPAARHAQLLADGFYKITNYDTVHRDLEAIRRWAPDVVILDEAQRIKNWTTRAARSVKQITSPYAIVLTGTPLENRLQELVSIVEFVDRHRLGPTYRFLHDHQLLDDGGRVVGYRNLDRIGRTLAAILIRRRKAEVLAQLPGRLEKRLVLPMTTQQLAHHEENREIVARIVHKWRRYRFLSEADQRRLMVALQRMRMACDSTYLLDATTDFGPRADEAATLLEEIFEEPDTKVVVFSQWVRMHELLVRRFEQRRWDHVLFHGGVDDARRTALVDRFRDDPRCRAFLSTDAGGVGLNLQHASVVLNMDLPWNPAVLEQRIGRVHRLGQTRPVRVVHFIAQGTIEEGMLARLGFKRSLFAGVLDGGEREVFLGGSRLARFMESVEQATARPGGENVGAVDAPDGCRVGDPLPAAPLVDALGGLLRSGLALLEQMSVRRQSIVDHVGV
jgi:superfamily II DNA or RNA helicase